MTVVWRQVFRKPYRHTLVLQCRHTNRSAYKYTQGQYNTEDPTVREYFYYIDHNGMLFLDDSRMKNFTSCFKEQRFLRFFFRNVRLSSESANSRVHEYFPFTSICGKERNYIRVEATPFTFTKLTDNATFEYNYTGFPHDFDPASLYEGSDGRVYHSFTKSKAIDFALVRSAIADEISTWFLRDGGDELRVPGRDDVVKLDFRVRSSVEEWLARCRRPEE